MMKTDFFSSNFCLYLHANWITTFNIYQTVRTNLSSENLSGLLEIILRHVYYSYRNFIIGSKNFLVFRIYRTLSSYLLLNEKVDLIILTIEICCRKDFHYLSRFVKLSDWFELFCIFILVINNLWLIMAHNGAVLTEIR